MPVRMDRITSAGLVLCEGADDLAFLEWVRADLGIDPETLRIQSIGGRPALHDNLMALSLRDEDRRLRALGIVCDADREDGKGAFGRVRDDLRTTRCVVPTAPIQLVSGAWIGGASLSVGVFILPDNQSSGALEELCLESIGDDPSLSCVDELLRCVAAAGVVWREQWAAKARLNVWLGSREDPRRRLPEAVRAGLFPTQSPAFDPIRQFLLDLAAAAQTTDTTPSA